MIDIYANGETNKRSNAEKHSALTDALPLYSLVPELLLLLHRLFLQVLYGHLSLILRGNLVRQTGKSCDYRRCGV